jgi:hypothetical protein
LTLRLRNKKGDEESPVKLGILRRERSSD